MKKSLQPGTLPLSDRLSGFLSNADDNDVFEAADDLDQIIALTDLEIQHFVAFVDLDLAIFVLNNRKIIHCRLSSYPVLATASASELSQYEVTPSGIHWTQLDADLSLRGLLLEETTRMAAHEDSQRI